IELILFGKKIPTLLDLSPTAAKQSQSTEEENSYELRRTSNLPQQTPTSDFQSLPQQFQSTIYGHRRSKLSVRSSEAPSRNSLPEGLSPYFRVSTAVAPLPSLSSFFRASNRDIFLLTAAPSVEVILREGRKELPILPYSAQSHISSSSLFCFHSLGR
ncbi:hypothetical protein LINPERHAP1_LOCUS34358, partial [Linum perenne]